MTARLETGDCRDALRRLIAEGVKVQMCVTSPPYRGLRDYGVEGPEEYLTTMVEVFRLVREVLVDDGTIWVNMPPKLVEPCILAGSRPGDIVLDPFLGSATTAEVAERLGRGWIGIDLNPAYEPMQKKRTAQQGMALHA